MRYFQINQLKIYLIAPFLNFSCGLAVCFIKGPSQSRIAFCVIVVVFDPAEFEALRGMACAIIIVSGFNLVRLS